MDVLLLTGVGLAALGSGVVVGALLASAKNESLRLTIKAKDIMLTQRDEKIADLTEQVRELRRTTPVKVPPKRAVKRKSNGGAPTQHRV